MNQGLLHQQFWAARVRRLIKRAPAKLGQIVLGRGSQWVYQQLGMQLLNKAQTAEFLAPHQVVTHPANKIALPAVVGLDDPSKVYFPATEAESEPVSVWQLYSMDETLEQLPYGVIRTHSRILCTDMNIDDLYRNVLHLTKREPHQTRTLLAPWSHYLDGVVWGGYFDFVLLVVGKLCRMKDALPDAVFNEALVAYPLFNTDYEREYLSLLGIQADRVVDSRTIQVRFEQCVLANVGHWFYPNRADVQALRKHIMGALPAPTRARNRVYISRAGRRRVLNEAELIEVLKRYDIEYIEDKPRTVTEQVSIYQRAEFIIGPHGASFVNMLWCQPGTYLLELFAPTYTPDFYRNMAELLGMRYAAYHYGPAATGDWTKGLEDDIYVSIPELTRCLDEVFG